MSSYQTLHKLETEFDGADADMAHRLLSLKREPSSALMARLRAIPGQSQQHRWWVPSWAGGVAAMLVLGVMLILASPSLRAAIIEFQGTIGGIRLVVTDRSPDSNDATIHEPELMTLQEAQAALPFAFGIPQQVPDGWSMAEQVRVWDFGNGPWVEVSWWNDGRAAITLSARSTTSAGSDWLIGPNSSREIQVAGQTAAVIKGAWDHKTQEWRWPDVTTLMWAVDGIQYSLMAAGGISDQDLIAIAESVR